MSSIKHKVKKIYKSFIFNLSKNNNKVFIGFYKYLYKPAPTSISWFINEFSKNKKSVFVLQVGANDGINHDPIHKFIKRDKWAGTLIEPQKYVYDNFLKKLHEKSKVINTLNAALGEKDGQMPIYKLSFTNDRWATGLSTFIKKEISDKVDDGSIEYLAKKNGNILPKNKADYIAEEQIQVISPASLRTKFNIENIDILMVDVEGFDYEVIKMLIDADFTPEAMIFEHSHFSEQTLINCKNLLESNHYKYKMINANTLAVKENTESEDIFKRFNKN